MSVSQERVDFIIEKRLSEMRAAVAAQQEEEISRADLLRRPMTSWNTVPADVDDDVIVAILHYLQTDEDAIIRFREGFLDDLQGRFLRELAASDKPRLFEIDEKLRRIVSADVIKPSMLFQVIVEPPAEDDDWTVVVVPVKVDENLEVSVAPPFPSDLCLSVHVTPRTGESLSQQFNIPAIYIPEGEAIRPLAISYKPDSEGLKVVHVSGYVSRNDHVHPIIIEGQFKVEKAPELTANPAPDKTGGPG